MMKQQSPITIGVLAKRANVGVETVRYYERKALIEQPPKIGGFRHYLEDDVKRIRLVKKMQEIGFTLDEIKEFLVFDTCAKSNALIRQKSAEKLVEIKQKIADLNSVVSALETFVSSCGSDRSKSVACELIDCFENNWECCHPPS